MSDDEVEIQGERVPVRRTGESPAYALAPFPEMWPDSPVHRRITCNRCREPVLERLGTGIPPEVPRLCCFCVVLADCPTPAPPEVLRMLDEWQALRRHDPLLLRDLVVVLFNRAGLARVTPETARQLARERRGDGGYGPTDHMNAW